jgi:pimeloyl-ACP methyl ester carboxylesterase
MEPARTTANGLEFAYLHEGPESGPLALCLHGFPDSAHSWDELLPALADAGYHAVAPFLRGYAPTAIPQDGLYQTGALARDVNRLHEALGGTAEAVIVGHDWGALATYGAVAHEPDRWRRVVTMAVPPTASVAQGFFRFDQLKRSWYTFFFQTALAEIAVPMDDYAFIDRLWADWSPGFDGARYARRAKEAIGTPERTLAAIGYYRALYDPGLHDPGLADEQAASLAPTPRPTLYLHGADDGCFSLDSFSDPLTFLAPGSAFETVAGAGHFLHVEQPKTVNDSVLAFLSG